MHKKILVLVLIASLTWARTVPAADLLTAAAAASEVITAEVANMVADAKLGKVDEKKAEKVRLQIASARSKYVQAITQLDDQIKRLETNRTRTGTSSINFERCARRPTFRTRSSSGCRPT